MFNFDMRKIILKLLLLLLVVSSVCLVVDTWYRSTNGNDYMLPRHFLVDPEIPEKYQIVTVGNSHAQSGIRFENYKIKSLNLSGVAQRFSLDYAQLRQHSRQIEKGAIVIIPVTPISFSHKPVDVHDSLQTNYYASVSPFLIPRLHIGNYVQTMIVPFVRSGYLLRSQYAHGIQERLAKENRNPLDFSAKTSQPVTADSPNKDILIPTKTPNTKLLTEPDFSTIFIEPFSDNLDFLYGKWYNTPEFNTKYFDENRRDLEKIIDYSLKQGWQPVLVTIPISQALRETLLDDYMDLYLYENMQKTNTQGVPYFDFSDEQRLISDTTYYANADHFNNRGASLFSYMLLKKLIAEGLLSNEVDGFDYQAPIQ